ncbi:hypothetical protein SAMN05421688_0676 [Poseidonocella pacifica]|uniref:Chitin binding Peritrophin-A domain-containing protein n=1 Tax=Poseidonocella pacifica TaxID=871651 RepID=A0A1I0VJK9_9RHOB|nr:hypothetical protein [Poseidonocella pacifica]SFA76203.1 hypothetical protein SAMN05421688_0676 [Poseidonocella pacifica]
MKIYALIAASLLALGPAAALSACPAHSEQAMSCTSGNVWDSDTERCVPNVTG